MKVLNVNSCLLIFLLFLFGFSQAQETIDESLKKELDGIYKSDQILREYVNPGTAEIRKTEILIETGYSKSDLENDKAHNIIRDQDYINLVRVEEIIAKYGYPGKTLVGEPTNEAAWSVILHSKKIADYFPLIQDAAASNELSFTKVATMQDKILMQEGKEQLYGTQIVEINILNPKSGKKEIQYYVWPIQHAEFVNELRKEAGFTTTVEENAKSLGIVYKQYSLGDIKQLTIKE